MVEPGPMLGIASAPKKLGSRIQVVHYDSMQQLVREIAVRKKDGWRLVDTGELILPRLWQPAS